MRVAKKKLSHRQTLLK